MMYPHAQRRLVENIRNSSSTKVYRRANDHLVSISYFAIRTDIYLLFYALLLFVSG